MLSSTQEGFLCPPHPPLPSGDCEPQESRAWAVSVMAGARARREQAL